MFISWKRYFWELRLDRLSNSGRGQGLRAVRLEAEFRNNNTDELHELDAFGAQLLTIEKRSLCTPLPEAELWMERHCLLTNGLRSVRIRSLVETAQFTFPGRSSSASTSCNASTSCRPRFICL